MSLPATLPPLQAESLEELRRETERLLNELRQHVGRLTQRVAETPGDASLSVYLGDPMTDGSWRFTVAGTSLDVQYRSNSSWCSAGGWTP